MASTPLSELADALPSHPSHEPPWLLTPALCSSPGAGHAQPFPLMRKTPWGFAYGTAFPLQLHLSARTVEATC